MPIRVLIVDTDENFCQNVSQRLLIEKYRVVVTLDVMEAKKITQRSEAKGLVIAGKHQKDAAFRRGDPHASCRASFPVY